MSLGIEPKRDAGGALICVAPADSLACLTFEPDEPAAKDTLPPSESAPRQSMDWPSGPAGDIAVSDKMQHIGEDLHDADKIAAAIEKWKVKGTPEQAASLEEGINNLEASLLAIWRKVLANTQIGIHDNFFEAGGSSIKAVMVIARIKQELKRSLSIVTLFECPTVRMLAAKLGTAHTGPVGESSGHAAEQRGRQRRHRKAGRGGP